MVLTHKRRHEVQWNRIDDPDMNPHSHAHLILTKVPKTYDREKTGSEKGGCLPEENLN
jgi:hypothetical protein